MIVSRSWRSASFTVALAASMSARRFLAFCSADVVARLASTAASRRRRRASASGRGHVCAAPRRGRTPASPARARRCAFCTSGVCSIGGSCCGSDAPYLASARASAALLLIQRCIAAFRDRARRAPGRPARDRQDRQRAGSRAPRLQPTRDLVHRRQRADDFGCARNRVLANHCGSHCLRRLVSAAGLRRLRIGAGNRAAQARKYDG